MESRTIDPLLTRAEVCEILRIRPTKLWELTAQGRLVAVRVGGSVRYTVRDVEDYIELNRDYHDHLDSRLGRTARPFERSAG